MAWRQNWIGTQAGGDETPIFGLISGGFVASRQVATRFRADAAEGSVASELDELRDNESAEGAATIDTKAESESGNWK